jgi:hypothetical protein
MKGANKIYYCSHKFLKVNDKILDVPKMWQNERLQQQQMTTNAVK